MLSQRQYQCVCLIAGSQATANYADSIAIHPVLRQIVSLSRDVDPQVLPEIDELQRTADGIALF